ncbi:MAG: hypothetical protein ACRERC_05955, partial [Candidatus Binatia bacterium]
MRNFLRTLVPTLLVALTLAAAPAAAGTGVEDCCICQNCQSGPAVQCQMAPTTTCNLACMNSMCTLLEVETDTPCAEVAACPAVPAEPASAPALGAGGLSLAAIALAGFGMIALRRARR